MSKAIEVTNVSQRIEYWESETTFIDVSPKAAIARIGTETWAKLIYQAASIGGGSTSFQIWPDDESSPICCTTFFIGVKA